MQTQQNPASEAPAATSNTPASRQSTTLPPSSTTPPTRQSSAQVTSPPPQPPVRAEARNLTIQTDNLTDSATATSGTNTNGAPTVSSNEQAFSSAAAGVAPLPKLLDAVLTASVALTSQQVAGARQKLDAMETPVTTRAGVLPKNPFASERVSFEQHETAVKERNNWNADLAKEDVEGDTGDAKPSESFKKDGKEHPADKEPPATKAADKPNASRLSFELEPYRCLTRF